MMIRGPPSTHTPRLLDASCQGRAAAVALEMDPLFAGIRILPGRTCLFLIISRIRQRLRGLSLTSGTERYPLHEDGGHLVKAPGLHSEVSKSRLQKTLEEAATQDI